MADRDIRTGRLIILFRLPQENRPEIALIVASATVTARKHLENITGQLGVESRLAPVLEIRGQRKDR